MCTWSNPFGVYGPYPKMLTFLQIKVLVRTKMYMKAVADTEKN